MIRTTIFDIPIYSMSEECFNKKWDEAVASKIQNYDQLKNTGFFYPKCVWKYNYIIGHVEISVSYDTVWFDVYLVNMKHLPFLSEKKHYIVDQHVNGLHFYALDFSNEVLRERIHQILYNIQLNYLKKPHWLDYTVFENVANYTDIRRIMQNNRESK